MMIEIGEFLSKFGIGTELPEMTSWEPLGKVYRISLKKLLSYDG